jgi:hypothetical protein
MRNEVPTPFIDETLMFPCRDSIPRLTTSMPTPRPETSVISFAVDKPG